MTRAIFENAAGLIILIGALIGALGLIFQRVGRVVKAIRTRTRTRFAEEVSEIILSDSVELVRQVDDIRHQLKGNDGSTLNDKIEETHQAVTNVETKVDLMDVRLENIEQQLEVQIIDDDETRDHKHNG